MMKGKKIRRAFARKVVNVITIATISLISAAICSAWETKDPQLAKEWEAAIGFKAPDVVGTVAPEVKEGLVIDSSNYKNYPGLKDLLLPSLYSRLDPGCYAPLSPIKIAKTDQYHLSKGFLAKTLLSEKTCKLAEDNLTLVGYQGGFPFLHPKNGNELVQWSDNVYLGDTFAMRPMRLRLYGRDNKPEREMRQELQVVRYKYNTDWREDIVPNPEDINYITSGTFVYPRDISGTAYTRKHYCSAAKPDEFLLYVASMRRIRRMSGRDTQDPLFGSDLVWDDYNVCNQKFSPTDFPNDYMMKPRIELLSPTIVDFNWPNDRVTAGYTDYSVDESGEQLFVRYGNWQRRPFYTCELIAKDKGYLYSKRLMLMDVENMQKAQAEMYDQSGRLWRSWVRDTNISGDGDGIMENIIDIVDHINQHRTVLDFKGHKNPRWLSIEYTDVRFLSRKAK